MIDIWGRAGVILCSCFIVHTTIIAFEEPSHPAYGGCRQEAARAPAAGLWGPERTTSRKRSPQAPGLHRPAPSSTRQCGSAYVGKHVEARQRSSSLDLQNQSPCCHPYLGGDFGTQTVPSKPEMLPSLRGLVPYILSLLSHWDFLYLGEKSLKRNSRNANFTRLAPAGGGAF